MADMFQEDGVTYREIYDNDPYEGRYANIGLKRQPSLGPWLVMGLGIILMCFLAYLVYSNVLMPPVVFSSPERSLRMIAASTLTTTALPAPRQQHPQPLGITGRAVPQSRAANALLGGQGPASPPGLVAASPNEPSEPGTSAAVTSR
jgi:hypothetical protein